MTRTLTLVAALAALSGGAALADDDCRVPAAEWQPREAVMKLAGQKQWSVREIDIDDGCYEIEGRDGDGRAIEVKLDPATLTVIELGYEDGGARNPAPAGTVAPPRAPAN